MYPLEKLEENYQANCCCCGGGGVCVCDRDVEGHEGRRLQPELPLKSTGTVHH